MNKLIRRALEEIEGDEVIVLALLPENGEELQTDMIEMVLDLEVGNDQLVLGVEAYTSLERLNEILARTGEVSMEQWGYLGLAVEGIVRPLFLESAEPQVSLESIETMTPAQRYVLATEGIGDTLKSIWEKIVAFVKGIIDWIKDFLGIGKKRAEQKKEAVENLAYRSNQVKIRAALHNSINQDIARMSQNAAEIEKELADLNANMDKLEKAAGMSPPKHTATKDGRTIIREAIERVQAAGIKTPLAARVKNATDVEAKPLKQQQAEVEKIKRQLNGTIRTPGIELLIPSDEQATFEQVMKQLEVWETYFRLFGAVNEKMRNSITGLALSAWDSVEQGSPDAYQKASQQAAADIQEACKTAGYKDHRGVPMININDMLYVGYAVKPATHGVALKYATDVTAPSSENYGVLNSTDMLLDHAPYVKKLGEAAKEIVRLATWMTEHHGNLNAEALAKLSDESLNIKRADQYANDEGKMRLVRDLALPAAQANIRAMSEGVVKPLATVCNLAFKVSDAIVALANEITANENAIVSL